jgi:hypothetical protein
MRGACLLILPFFLATRVARAEELHRSELVAKHGFFVSVDGGYAYQSLYGIGMTGAEIDVALGGDVGRFAAGAVIEVIPAGWTEYGLRTTTVSAGALFEGHVNRLRLGGGPRIGAFTVQRVTRDASILGIGEGLYTRASIDVVHFGDEADATLYAVLKAGVDWIGGPLFGVTAGLGARF